MAMSVEARRERKVVTVLFADLVGFTSRSETLDPEDVEAFLRPYHDRLRSELERHGGTVEKFIGDAAMALFGAPVAHEDDPERAVRAALAIRDWAKEEADLEVRIGLTTGEALVTLEAGEREGMAAGDVVNTAKRLESAAPVNGILVDETTHRATRDRISYRGAEAVTAKGKADPVPVWVAQEARARFGVDVIQTGAVLVGRQRELDLLKGALERARVERSPQLVTLVGVPGIGKSRLVYELSRVVEADPDLLYWRQGRSLPYGEGVTYWALAEMAKAQAGILESDAPDEAERKLAEAVAVLHPEGAESVLESLRPLVGLAAEQESGDRAKRFAAWREFFEALADDRPTVLVFDDLHWADDDLLDFVDHLVDWSSGVPLLIVCNARPELLERRPGWGGGKPNALTLSISPLSDDDTARLLSALLERAVLPAETQASLLARAGGNPLYAEQFARLLAESAGAELPVPENVQGIIAARLDGLALEEKQLLQDAAVLGKVFWLGAVCAVGGLQRQEAEERLHTLERKEFVRRERRSSVAGEDEYAFRHVLVRDVAYGQIPRGARAERHENAAAWIDALGRPEDHAETLAHHYLEALRLRIEARQERPAELFERARLAARDAGDRGLALGSYPAAARFYEAALELWPADDEGKPELVLAYATSRIDDVAFDDGALEQAAQELQRSGNDDAAARALTLLGGIWMNRGDGRRALAHVERARELVEDRAPSHAKALVLQELSRLLMMNDDFAQAMEVGLESLRIADELGLDGVRSRDLNTIGVARIHGGDVEEGLRDIERAVEIGTKANSHEGVAAAANLAWMTVILGDLRRSWEMHQETWQLARRFGLATYMKWQQGEHAVHCHWRGLWAEAGATADEFISAAAHGHYQEAGCRLIRAAISLARGDSEAALVDAERVVVLARPAADPQVVNPALAFGAFVRLELGDRVGANELADELADKWRSIGANQPHELVYAAWAFRELGRGDELEKALARGHLQTPWQEAARQVLSGDLAMGADTYDRIGSVPDEAHARLRAAEKLAGEGRQAAAEAQLRIALPVFAELGATAWQAEAESLLAASA
jgi:class 3 adenylate cyclase/tetratricopeptide (TPR) repeat protein